MLQQYIRRSITPQRPTVLSSSVLLLDARKRLPHAKPPSMPLSSTAICPA